MKKYSFLFIISLFTLLSCKEDEPLNAPLATQATDVQPESFTANWEASNSNTYLLFVAEDSSFTNFVSGYDGKNVTGTSHAVYGLKSNFTYFYQLKAVKDGNASAFSNVMQVRTAKHIILAPVALECKNVAADSLTARWNAVSGAEEYVLELAYDENFQNYVEGMERVFVTGLTYNFTGLKPNTIYYFRLRALRNNTWSRYSNVIECETLGGI
jgi:chitodextrinase